MYIMCRQHHMICNNTATKAVEEQPSTAHQRYILVHSSITQAQYANEEVVWNASLEHTSRQTYLPLLAR